MKNTRCIRRYFDRRILTKTLRLTKITAILLLFCLLVSAKGYSQKVTLSEKNASLEKVLSAIKKQTGYVSFFDEATMRQASPVTIEVKEVPLEKALDLCFKNTPLAYSIVGKTIVVKLKDQIPKEKESVVNPQGSIEISGMITDEMNKGLQGASVTIKGSERGTSTDANGNFGIQLPDNGADIVISYVGYEIIETKVTKSATLNFALKPKEAIAEDLVVVGYGSQKKVNLTGAVASVSGKDLNKRRVVNPVSMLEGLLPGVSVVQNSGQPGNEAVSIQIRGKGTYSAAGSDPLVLINGVPGRMETLDPNNIESVSVLKDAASASIYGARAANGVILVTTKDGSQNGGKFSVSYNMNYGVSTPTKMPDLVTNSVDYMNLFNQAKANSGITGAAFLYPQSVIDLYKNPPDPIKYPNADWASLMFEPAPTTSHYLSISGGQKTTFNASIGYTNQEGTMKAFNYKKYNAAFNLASTISKKFKVGFNVDFLNGITSQPRNGAQDGFYQTIAHAPTALPYVADGSGLYTFKAYSWEAVRPNQFAAMNQLSNSNNYSVAAQIFADYEILDGLHWYTKAAVNGVFGRGKTFSSTINTYGYLDPIDPGLTLSIPGNGLDETMNQNIYNNVYSYLNYEKLFGKHRLGAQAGYSQEEQNNYYLGGSRPNYSTDLLQELNAGNVSPQFNNGTSNSWGLQSFFGRLKYSLSDKYLFEANLRYDGSSRFSPDSRWGVFPSFSGAWRISQENFMQNIKKAGVLNDLKIRGSWGTLGNQNIGLYPYQAVINIGGNYSFDNKNLSTGAYQNALNNENISWETTTMSNIGFDAVLFRHLTMTFDAFKKTTTDILRNAQVAGVVGMSAPVINDGAMTNTGLEFALNYRNNVDKGTLRGLSYNIGFNMSGFKNETTKFGAKQDNGATVIEEGKPWNSFYLLQWDGIFQSQHEVDNAPKQFGENTVPGDLKFKDVNSDGVIDNKDRVITTKGVFPSYVFGVNLSASWKNFDLYCFIQSVQGQKGIFGYGRDAGLTPFFAGTPPSKDVMENAWTPQNHSNTMPQLYFSDAAGSEKVWNHPSTFLLHDMSYVRVKSLQLGYNLPVSIARKMHMDLLRFYVSADNMFTFTKFPGLDPEKPTGSYLSYPQNKTLSAGVSVRL